MTIKRKKTPEQELKEAVEGGDNLDILKAHRKVIIKNITKTGLEIRETAQLSSTLRQVTNDIIKLEGSKEKFDDETEEEFDEDSSFRNSFGGSK